MCPLKTEEIYDILLLKKAKQLSLAFLILKYFLFDLID